MSELPGEGADPTVPDPPSHIRRGRHRTRQRVIEWAIVALFAVLVAVGLRSYVVQTFFVPSGSMLPTLQIGDRMLVDKLPWVRDDIQRGDIVVFARTPSDDSTTAADLVKRVIGLPGERISSVGDTILINGKRLREPWLPALVGVCYQSDFDITSQVIPAGHYFVMGDCRGDSEDSRFWGTVPQSYIVGKVFVVIWRHNHPWLHWF